MSQRNIGGAGKPPIGFRVDRHSNKAGLEFETMTASREEDLYRARRLKKAARDFPNDLDTSAALTLAGRLEAAAEGREVTESLASSLYMRTQRINIVGWLWYLIANCLVKRVHGFTIIPATWEFTAEQLAGVDPMKLLKRMLSAIYGRGAGTAEGWMFAYLHGEWDPIGQVYRLHVHGFACGGMVEVIDGLRNLPNYKTQMFLKDGRLSPVYRRVKMTREQLRNLPRPITYRLQSYWPMKALFVSDDGARRRAKRKRRIPEPQHSQVLLWLDRWKISDLTLMVGLRMTQHGLKQTKSVS